MNADDSSSAFICVHPRFQKLLERRKNMSISFEHSHQRVGLNRVGLYMQPALDERPLNCRQDAGDTGGETPAVRNEPWRRWTGMVGSDENRLTWKQRKRGIRRLLRQIERRVAAWRNLTNYTTAERLCANEWANELGNWARSK